MTLPGPKKVTFRFCTLVSDGGPIAAPEPGRHADRSGPGADGPGLRGRPEAVQARRPRAARDVEGRRGAERGGRGDRGQPAGRLQRLQ